MPSAGVEQAIAQAPRSRSRSTVGARSAPVTVIVVVVRSACRCGDFPLARVCVLQVEDAVSLEEPVSVVHVQLSFEAS